MSIVQCNPLYLRGEKNQYSITKDYITLKVIQVWYSPVRDYFVLGKRSVLGSVLHAQFT